MIFQPFYNSCGRDEGLLELSVRWMGRHGDDRIAAPLITHDRTDPLSASTIDRLRELDCTIIDRPGGFGPTWGWHSSMVGLVTLGKAARRLAHLADDDWLIKLDSDTIIVATGILDAVAELDADVRLAGFLQDSPPITALHGPLMHCGGRCQFIRMSLVRRLGKIDKAETEEVRREMDADSICLYEDVVLSYAAMRRGVRIVGLDPREHECGSQTPDEILIDGPSQGSMLHIDGFKGPVGGTAIAGRAEIPEVLKHLGKYPESAKPQAVMK